MSDRRCSCGIYNEEQETFTGEAEESVGKLKGAKVEVWQEKVMRTVRRKSLIIIRDGYGVTRIKFLVNSTDQGMSSEFRQLQK